MTQLVVSAAEHRALQDELQMLRQDEQAVADGRLAHIEELLAMADVLADDAGVGVVAIGCAVEVEYVRTGKRVAYRLVGGGTRLGLGVVSARSPIGQALMGRRAGETVAATLPSDRVEQLRVLSVQAPAEQVVDARG